MFKIIFYLFQYIICLEEDFLVGESHHMIPHSLQMKLPRSVIFLLSWLGMIAAVHLYDESAVAGGKVHDVVSHHMLAEELHA